MMSSARCLSQLVADVRFERQPDPAGWLMASQLSSTLTLRHWVRCTVIFDIKATLETLQDRMPRAPNAVHD
jgi:hypothetical protein